MKISNEITQAFCLTSRPYWKQFAHLLNKPYGPIAHLVELPAHNRTVAGSIPAGPTNKLAANQAAFFCAPSLSALKR